MNILPLFLFFPLLAPTVSEAPSAVGEVVRQVQHRYNKTRDLKGKFKQVYTDELYQRKRTHYGYLWVKKPGKMRWKYDWPEKKFFISDGKTLWFYEPRDKQAFKNPLNSKTLSSGLAFLLGSGELKDEFSIAFAKDKKDLIGGPGHFVLKLSPKKPTTQYKYMVLAVRRSDYAVEESMLVKRHARNHFIFDKLVFNTKIQNWRFSFKPGPGVRVLGQPGAKKPLGPGVRKSPSGMKPKK